MQQSLNQPCRFLFLLPLLLLGGCLLFGNRAGEPSIARWPGGVVTRVEFGEKFLVFESSQPFKDGTELLIMRDGKQVGTLWVRPERSKRFYTGDILEGSAQKGDVVEAPLPTEPEESDEG